MCKKNGLIVSLLAICLVLLVLSSCTISNDPPTYSFLPINSVGLNTNGVSPEGYVVRPSRGEQFTLKVAENSDIWYLFSSGNSGQVVPDLNENTMRVTGSPLLQSLPIYSNLDNITFANSLDNASFSSNEIVYNSIQRIDCPRSTQIFDDKYFENLVESQKIKGYTKSNTSTKATIDEKYGQRIKLERMVTDTTDKEVWANRILKRTVKTAFGDRTLVIYEEEGMDFDNMPSSNDYKIIADAFLKKGYDNDIYDKLTAFFGSDWGNKKSGYYVPEDDYITLFFCNIGEQGNPEDSYTGGYFYGEYNSNFSVNQRNMITLHAPTSGGEYLGSCLTTISHEFQHLLHFQNFTGRDGTSVNECFSSLAESLTAEFIAEQTKQPVPGPFFVGVRGVPNYETNKYEEKRNTLGYLPNENDYRYCFKNGRGKFFLYSMDNLGFLDWNNQLHSYGIVASFAHWFLVNYGVLGVEGYANGNIADLEGLSSAIHQKFTATPDGPNNEATMIADWGTACLLSAVKDMNSPYSMNKEGWFKIFGMKVPSVNMWNYYRYDESTGVSEKRGIIDSEQFAIPGDGTNVPKKVKQNVLKGQTFSATAPNYGTGTVFTVVAVPRRSYV